VTAIENVIAPYIEAIDAERAWHVQDEIRAVEPGTGSLVLPGEKELRLSREGIHQLSRDARQVSPAEVIGRNHLSECGLARQPYPFVVKEKERPIVSIVNFRDVHWAAERTAKAVGDEGWLQPPIGISRINRRKRIGGIERLVLVEPHFSKL